MMKHVRSSTLLVSLIIAALGAAPSAQAQNNAGDIPEFVPTSPWIVGGTGLAEARGLEGVQLPCMMVNQFDNGFVMRLAGGGEKLTAMAIDFRQPIFAPGRRYAAAMYTDAGFRGTAQGTAFNNATLIFNLRDAGDVYGALKNGRVLGLSIGNNDMRFALNNLAQGMQQLEGCYNGDVPAPTTQQAAMQAQQMDNSGQAAADDMTSIPDFSEQPTSLAQIQQAAPVGNGRTSGREVYIKRGEKMPRGVNTRMGASPAQMAPNGQWTASAGENVQTVLSRWADAAGVQLDWQANNSGQVAQDFTHSGSFEDAVGALLSENAAVSGLRSNFDDGSGPRARAPSYVSHQPTPLTPEVGRSNNNAAGMDYATGGRWMAPRGGSLQAVLQQWSNAQGVELLWYADSGYTIKDDINQGGSFESALQSLLESYATDTNRPVARLNTDPGSGRKVLVIESDRTL